MAKKKISFLDSKVKDLKEILERGILVYGEPTNEIQVLLDEGFIKKSKDKEGNKCFVKK